MKAFWFGPNSCRLAFLDNRPVVIGESHSVEDDIVVGKNGLHGSEKLVDALLFAQYTNLYLVELSGDMAHTERASAARTRKYLAKCDCKWLLHNFIKQIALLNIHRLAKYKDLAVYDDLVKYLSNVDAIDYKHIRAFAEFEEVVAKDRYTTHNKDAIIASYLLDAVSYTLRPWTWHVIRLAIDNILVVASVNEAKEVGQIPSSVNEILTALVRKQTGWDI